MVKKGDYLCVRMGTYLYIEQTRLTHTQEQSHTYLIQCNFSLWPIFILEHADAMTDEVIRLFLVNVGVCDNYA